jgi:hypothetical protein
MPKKDPLKLVKDTTKAVFEACKAAGLEVTLDMTALVIHGDGFHIKVKDIPHVKAE